MDAHENHFIIDSLEQVGFTKALWHQENQSELDVHHLPRLLVELMYPKDAQDFVSRLCTKPHPTPLV